VERSFEEERRRSKVIPRFFDEKSGLKLVFATLIRASQRWRRVAITFDEEIKIVKLRDKLNQQDRGEQTTSINLRMPQLGDKIFQKK
jgi:transposase-like protein